MRKIVLATIVPFGLIAAACGTTGDEDVTVADSNGEIIIDMDEFSFGTDLIEVQAGDTVTFVLVNDGANEHEFMIGRNMIETEEGYPNGFEHDFFEDVTPMVEPPGAGMDMGAMDDMAGMDMSGDDAEMDMSGDDAEMDMSGDDAEMDMSGDDAEMDMSGDDAEMDMSGDDADADMPADEGAAGEEAHAGYMVQRLPGEAARLTVTIPEDAVGEWDIGCFRGRGSHWDAGMRSTLMVTA